MLFVLEVNVNRYFEVQVDADDFDDAMCIAESLYADVHLDEADSVEVNATTDTMIHLVGDTTSKQNSFVHASVRDQVIREMLEKDGLLNTKKHGCSKSEDQKSSS